MTEKPDWVQEFMADRHAALLSMDKDTLLAYGQKWGVNFALLPSDDETFWAAVHMARTGARDLPMPERIISKKWLTERGLRSLDDGEVIW